MKHTSLLKLRANKALNHILRELWDDLPGIEDERRATQWEGLISVWVLEFCINMRDRPRPAAKLVPLLNRYVRRSIRAAGVPLHFTTQDMAAVQFELTRGLLIGLGYFASPPRSLPGPVELAHSGYYLTLCEGVYRMTWEMGTSGHQPSYIPLYYSQIIPDEIWLN